jgi:hypothetical protein
MSQFERSRDNLQLLVQKFEKEPIENLNEANTRFYYIDQILTQCLGWELADISNEDNYDGKYTDYTLSLFRSVAILEAKKTGIYFELPSGSKKLIVPLKTVYNSNPDIRAAINQVKGYCHERSVQIAIVSNGWQFIAFIANRNDSVPVLEGNALVIPNLDCFYQNFQEVWNFLSKSGFEENNLLKKLTGNIEVELPKKLSSTIFQYPGIKDRNPFQTELEIISDLVLEDVIKDKDLEKEFLTSCYCTSGALSSYSLVSKAILTTRYDYLFEENDKKATLEQVTGKKGISKELVDIFANSLSKRPVLLVGDVGVGKSTFIDYLRLVEAPKVFEKALSFKIDLGSSATITLDIKSAIIDLLKQQLINDYLIDIEEDDFVRHCYFVELEQFKKSVKVKSLYTIDPPQALKKEIEFLTELVDNKIEHLKKSLEYICRNQKKQIIVFIDNCDQRSDQDQESAFLIAHEFASNWPMIVFISIRPETFHKTKKESGALSGYHTKAFTIPPPRLDEVIKKRLEFAQKITTGEISLSKLNTHINFSTLHSLIEVFLASCENNKSLMTFINNVSNENIRKAIELIKKFFGSGHVDMGKILMIYNTKGKYTIPIHELLRAIIFGDNIHYAPFNSEIINVFEIRHNNSNEHFILLILLSLLDDYSKNSRNNGFISINEVYKYMQGVGYLPVQIDTILNFAFSKKLFESSQKGDLLEIKNTELQIRATNLGIYHLRFLINLFTYVDAMIVDTPIFDDNIRIQIHNYAKINERLTRAELFRTYLDNQWTNAGLKSSNFDWMTFSHELKHDIETIEGRLKTPTISEDEQDE